LCRRSGVEVGRDQLLDFKGLKPNVTPKPRDVRIVQVRSADWTRLCTDPVDLGLKRYPQRGTESLPRIAPEAGHALVSVGDLPAV
jgi:hypothetical protein